MAWDAKKGEPIPDLARSWHVESPTAWVFNLRRNVRWQDGTPFTAADAVHSLQRVGDHPKAREKDRVRNIARVEAIDDYTVRVITREPDAELLDSVFVVGIAMTSKAQLDRGADLWEGASAGHRSLCPQRMDPERARGGSQGARLVGRSGAGSGRGRLTAPCARTRCGSRRC